MPATDSHDGLAHGRTPTPPDATMVTGGASRLGADQFNPGDIVGGSYVILHALGRGAMGMVYKAKHVNMEAEYALKVLSTDFLNANAILRFQNEAQALAKLNHPNVIAIYNFGLHDDRLPFYVMEFLSGENLLDKVEKHGPMPLQLALPIFVEVCTGLSYAHRKGILHRDVKPANFVMLNNPDVRGARVKVVDFGLVKFSEEVRPDVQKLTAMGEVCGSPSYMSPEQTSGQKCDPRSDIYSLGCSLFQAITGKLPFRGRTATETMMMQHEAPVPSLKSQGEGRTYPEDLELLVAKMMAKAPMDRYQNMESVAQDLRNVMEGKPLGTPSAAPIAEFGTGNYSATGAPGRASSGGIPAPIAGADMEKSQSMRRGEFSAAPPEDMNMATTARLRREDAAAGARRRPQPEAEEEGTISVKQLILVACGALVVLGLIGAGGYFAYQHMQPAKPAVVKNAPAPEQDKLDTLALPTLDPDGGNASEVQAKVKLTSAKYFSRDIKKDGKDFIEFDFPRVPPEQNIGFLARSFTDRARIDGKYVTPRAGRRYLVPLPVTANIPGFFEKFRPGDITGVFLSSAICNDRLFLSAVKVPGLQELQMVNCAGLSDKILPTLYKLKIKRLTANGLEIDGAKLAKADFWPDLETAELSMIKNITPILKALSGSKNLKVLDVSGAHLTAADYDLIATMPNLVRLNISDNKITPRDLRVLSKLKLTELCAFLCSMSDAGCADELCQFQQLRSMAICSGYIKPQDLQKLMKRCPRLRVATLDASQIDRKNAMPSMRADQE